MKQTANHKLGTIPNRLGCPENIARRAGGRRHVNAMRQEQAELRRAKILRLASKEGKSIFDRGFQSSMARRCGVARSTIWRDIHFIRQTALQGNSCPICGSKELRMLPG